MTVQQTVCIGVVVALASCSKADTVSILPGPEAEVIPYKRVIETANIQAVVEDWIGHYSTFRTQEIGKGTIALTWECVDKTVHVTAGKLLADETGLGFQFAVAVRVYVGSTRHDGLTSDLTAHIAQSGVQED